MPETAAIDENEARSLLAASSADGKTPIRVWADPNSHALLVSSSGASGSFTTADSKTVTIVNGVITSIV